MPSPVWRALHFISPTLHSLIHVLIQQILVEHLLEASPWSGLWGIVVNEIDPHGTFSLVQIQTIDKEAHTCYARCYEKQSLAQAPFLWVSIVISIRSQLTFPSCRVPWVVLSQTYISTTYSQAPMPSSSTEILSGLFCLSVCVHAVPSNKIRYCVLLLLEGSMHPSPPISNTTSSRIVFGPPTRHQLILSPCCRVSV